MYHTISTILILIGFWYAGMGWFWLARKYYHISYSAVATPVIYLLFCSGLIMSQVSLLEYLGQADYTGSVFLLSLCVHICALAIYIIKNPDHGFRGGRQDTMGQIRYWISKCSELVFQQIVLVSLSLVVISVFGEKYASLDEFTLIFFLMHLPLLGILPRYWAKYFILASILGGFLFGALHILYNQGLWIALAIHQMFYIITVLMQERRIVVPQSELSTNEVTLDQNDRGIGT